jgi:ribonuclease BN (tRNA processing enzyme)
VNRREFIAAAAVAPAALTGVDEHRPAGTPATIEARPLAITLLGTGTPAPSLERQSSGYLIEVGTDLIVWDHGPGAHHRLMESGHRTVDVTHAFFTHLHYDHCMDYGRLRESGSTGAMTRSRANASWPTPFREISRIGRRRKTGSAVHRP